MCANRFPVRPCNISSSASRGRIIALFGGLLRCEHDEATKDQRASNARGKPAAIADEPRSAAPMFGCRIEARRPRGCVEFGDQLVELLVAHPETFVPAEAQFAAVDYAYPSQQWRQSGLSSMSQRRLALRAHFGRLNSDQDPPFLNRTCAKPISFRLSPTWMIACGASSCTTLIAAGAGFSRTRTHRETTAHLRLLGVWAWCRSYLFSPGICWSGFSLNRSGSVVHRLQTNS
jgi:hypothetical protein